MDCPTFELAVFYDGTEVSRVSLEPGEYTIGRASSADIPITVGAVSRMHARLIVETTDLVRVADLASANGTFLDDRPVVEATRWTPGQTLRLGDVTLQLSLRNDGVAGPHAPTHSPHSVPGKVTPSEILTDDDPDDILRRNLPLRARAAQIYAVGEEVARGGMGAVWQARESATRRVVAMKVMLGDGDVKSTLRFIEEAQVTAQLEHPNIVPVHDLGIDEDGQPFYTMKLVEGITLKNVIDQLQQRVPETIGKYPLGTLLTLFQKVCDALAFAHSRGVIHRDLKPANLMLGKFGEVLVMDWGLAKILDTPSHRSASESQAAFEFAITGARRDEPATFHTMSGSVMGTPQYMSPEQARGEVETLDARSDLFTLGIILYELVSLVRPFAGRTAAELVSHVAEGSYVAPAARVRQLPKSKRPAHLPGGEVPESLDAIVRKALAQDREQRYPTVMALQADLTAYQNGFATSAEKAGTWTQLKLFVARNRAVATSIAAALLVLVTVIAGFTNKVISERDRAERALGDLLKTAPTLVAEARKSIDAQQFDDALVKISFAVEIEPEHAAHRLLRAHLLQAMLRLDEAAAEFRRVLALAPELVERESARANLTLCEKLLRGYPSAAAFDPPALQMLQAQLAKEGRLSQSAPFSKRLGRDREAAEALLQSRLAIWRQLPEWDKNDGSKRVHWEHDGTLSLNLSRLPLPDLSSVEGLPLSRLTLSGAPVSDLTPLKGLRLRFISLWQLRKLTDISPLQGMPIETFHTQQCPIESITPLSGMPLKSVGLHDTRVKDYSPLRNLPIETLNISRASLTSLNDLVGLPLVNLLINSRSLTDISAVRTMRLRQVQFDGEWGKATALRDFSPLLDCPSLERAHLPRGIKEIEVLKRHAGLRKLRYADEKDSELKSPTEFWAAFDLDQQLNRPASEKIAAVAAKLRQIRAAGEGTASPLTETITVLSDGTMRVRVGQNSIREISGLNEFPISWLSLFANNVTDLAPLRGSSLRHLVLMDTKVTDVAPLFDCLKLESVVLSSTVKNVEPLRKHPTLRHLSYRYNSTTDRADQTTAEFWKEYDAQQKTGAR